MNVQTTINQINHNLNMLSSSKELGNSELLDQFQEVLNRFLKDTSQLNDEIKSEQTSINYQDEQAVQITETNFSPVSSEQFLSSNITLEEVPNDKQPQMNMYQSANLILENPYSSKSDRPTLQEFIQKTGVDHHKAVRIYYLGIENGQDYRNWEAIMGSGNPLSELKKANGQLLNSNINSIYADEKNYLKADRIIEQHGNIALYKTGNRGTELRLVTDTGLHKSIGSRSEVIIDTLDDYGLNAAVLSPLINKASELSASLADEMLAAINA